MDTPAGKGAQHLHAGRRFPNVHVFLFHLTDDIVHGMEPGRLQILIGGTVILTVWLCGTLLLGGRRSGHYIMLLGAPTSEGARRG